MRACLEQSKAENSVVGTAVNLVVGTGVQMVVKWVAWTDDLLAELKAENSAEKMAVLMGVSLAQMLG